MKHRYKDILLRSKRFIWIRGRDVHNNLMIERMSMNMRKTSFGRKTFSMVSKMTVRS